MVCISFSQSARSAQFPWKHDNNVHIITKDPLYASHQTNSHSATAQSVKDIYGPVTKGRKVFVKSEKFYDTGHLTPNLAF